MYEFIKGKLALIAGNYLVIDVSGIGYRIYFPPTHLSDLPSIGESIAIYTSYVIRDTTQHLYGFLLKEERDIFEILIELSGVGPKMALGILSHLSLEKLYHAVRHNSEEPLCKVPGVGKKTAQRLLIDLKDKLPTMSFVSISEITKQPSDPQIQKVKDAMSALINLGYTQQNAQIAIKKALKSLPENPDLTLLITAALREI